MIKIDAKKIKEVEKQLGSLSKQAPTLISRALNRAATNARTTAVKKAREGYNVKATSVRETIKITKSNKNTLGALVRSTGQTIALSKFKFSPKQPRPKNPPKLKVEVKKGGLKEVLGAFVADVNGNKIFQRTTNNRLPIKQLFGPSIPQMIGHKDTKSYVENEALKTFDARLEHEINRVLEGAK